MKSIIIENIVAYAVIADSLNVEDIVEKIPDFQFNPDEFFGATFKLDDPKTAVLILPSGKAVCTGAKNMEDVETSIKKITSMIKNIGIKVKTKPKIETQNIIASTDVEKELHLSSISKGLLLEHVNYEPDHFPGLIYNIDEIRALLLIFSSGKIVCTGAKNIEDTTKAIEMMKEKLSSIGAL
jgi:transcription initiation factor TFIID TATA-box-binding protein